jgi:pantoate--beta-alanine ligase
VEPADFSHILEGQARPEFFRGVATVVAKLFGIVTPDVADFGQKDISQCILIRNLASDLNMNVDIRIVETIRAADDGLALSSRNAYLTASERSVAGILFKALKSGKSLIEGISAGNEGLTHEDVVAHVEKVLRSEPSVSRIEYVSVASHNDMKDLSGKDAIRSQTGCVISSAIRLGNVRLIDNVLVGKANEILYVPEQTGTLS